MAPTGWWCRPETAEGRPRISRDHRDFAYNGMYLIKTCHFVAGVDPCVGRSCGVRLSHYPQYVVSVPWDNLYGLALQHRQCVWGCFPQCDVMLPRNGGTVLPYKASLKVVNADDRGLVTFSILCGLVVAVLFLKLFCS